MLEVKTEINLINLIKKQKFFFVLLAYALQLNNGDIKFASNTAYAYLRIHQKHVHVHLIHVVPT